MTPREQDTCPTCAGQRQQLVCAPERFYCPACHAAGPGPCTADAPPLAADVQMSLRL